jgi:curved DNA-binding protein CbpA
VCLSPRIIWGRGERELTVAEALEVLRLEPTAKRADVEEAFDHFVRRCHPDRGGTTEIFVLLTDVRDILRKKLKTRGRPQKYPNVRGYAIIDSNNAIRFRLKTRKKAVEYLKYLEGLSSDVVSDNSGMLYRVVGNARAERRRRRRAAIKRFVTQSGRGQSYGKYTSDLDSDGRGKFMEGADHGRGLLITGGYGSEKISAVDAAHKAHEGGKEYVARRVHPPGAGPDADEDDKTADAADAPPTSAMSAREWQDQMAEIEFQGSLVTAKGGVRDELLGESVEDRVLTPFEGFDQLPIDDSAFKILYDGDGEPYEVTEVGMENGKIEGAGDDTGLAPAIEDVVEESYTKLRLRAPRTRTLKPRPTAPELPRERDTLRLPDKPIELLGAPPPASGFCPLYS